MNAKTKVLVPVLRSLGLTLIVFAALLALWAAVAAHSIWIQGHHDTKFGDEWGNFRFYIPIFMMVLGVQCGILLLGNAVSAVLLGRAFSRISVITSTSFAVADGVMILLRVTVTDALFLFGMPTACALLALCGTLLEKAKRAEE